MKRSRVAPVVWMLAIALAAPGFAQERETSKTEPNTVERIREDVDHIADHLRNLEVRLKYVATRGGGNLLQTREAAKVQHPLTECCAINLEAVERHTALILDSLRILEADHRLRGDDEGRTSVVHAAETLRDFYGAFRRLKGAKQAAMAQTLRESCVREFNHFRRALDDYESCCFLGDLPAESESEPKKKKKRRKKRGEDSGSTN